MQKYVFGKIKSSTALYFTGETETTHHANDSDESRNSQPAAGYVLANCLKYALPYTNCIKPKWNHQGTLQEDRKRPKMHKGAVSVDV